jgi:hypothetical protein
MWGRATRVVTGALARPPRAARLLPAVQLPKGVTPRSASSYNDLVMSTVSDAAQQIQFASSLFKSGRVLAALLGLSKALSGESPFAPASQPLR